MDRYVTVERKDLFSDEAAVENTNDELLAIIDNAVKDQLSYTRPPTSDSPASKPKKAKRKRTEQSPSENDPVYAFKLVSGSQPQTISLQEPDVVAVISNKPTHEDTPEEEKERHLRAQQIAVDTAWLMKEAGTPWPSRKPHKQPITVTAEKMLDEIPPLLVVERQTRPVQPQERPPVAANANVPKVLVK